MRPGAPAPTRGAVACAAYAASVPKVRFVGGPYRGISVQINDPDDIQAQIDNRTSRRTTASRAGHYICDPIPDISLGGVGITIDAHWEPDVVRRVATFIEPSAEGR